MEFRLSLTWALVVFDICSVICTPNVGELDVGLAVTNYTGDSVTVRWGRPGVVELCWQKLPPEETAPACEHPPPGHTSHTLLLDDACQEYRISLTSADVPASSLEFSAARSGHEPGSPRGFKGSRYTGGVALFEWAPPLPPGNYCITHYSLRVYGGGDVIVEDSIPASATSREVRDLPVCSGLNVSLTAHSKAGHSSRPASFILQSQETAPGAVEDLVVTSSRSRTLRLSWRKPKRADCLREYSVCWRLAVQANETCATQPRSDEDLVSFVVSGLRSCTEYLLRVISVGAGQLQGISAVLSPSTGPEPVTNLRVDQISVHEATVSWTAPSCARLYSVCWGISSSLQRHHCLNTTVTSATVTDLVGVDEGCSHTVIVVALGHKGGASDTRNITLQRPKPVENFKLRGYTRDSIAVAWTQPPEHPKVAVDHVEVCWTASTDDGGGSCAELPPSTAFYLVEGLQPCNWYNVNVSNVHADGAKSEQKSVSQFTLADSTTPEGRLEYFVVRFEYDILLATWFLQDGCVSQVEVCWDADGSADSNCSVVPSYESQTIISGLQLCTNYTITATALSPSGAHLGNGTQDVFSGVGLPRNVTTVAVAPGTLRVTWLPPPPGEDCVENYELHGEVLPPNTTEYTVTGLTLCTYNVEALVVYPNVPSTSRGVIVYAAAGISAPGEVSDVTAYVARSQSIHVGWKKPAELAMCLKKYSVCWREANTTVEKCDFVGTRLYPKHTITGLKPCTEYIISVAGVGGNATGNYTSITKYTGPEAVGDIEARQLGPQEVELKWSSTQCASLYSVCWGPWNGNGSHSCMNVSDSKATVFDLRSLDTGVKYTTIVKAIGPTGSISDLTVVVLERICPVSNLSAANNTQETAVVSWDVAADCRRRVNRFEVCWEAVAYRNNECTHVPSASSSFELQHLAPCKWHNVTVSAVYVSGVTSEPKALLLFTDAASKRDPASPSLQKPSRKEGGVWVMWEIDDDPDACVANTELCWTWSTDNATSRCDTVPSYKQEFTIKDVEYCSHYVINGSALTLDGRRSEVTSTAGVLGPGQPRNVRARSPSPSTLLMTWEPPLNGSDCVHHYTIMQAWGSGLSTNTSANVTEYLLTDQPLCTFTFFAVVSFSEDGEHSEEVPSYASAGMGAPGEIRNLKTVLVESHAIHLQWSTPATYYDCLKKYSVCWSESSEASEMCSTQKVVPYPLHSVSGLKSCTEYLISVSSQGEEVLGNASQLLVTTGPEPVGNVNVGASSGPIVLRWAPSPCAVSYSVCWGEWSDKGRRSCLTTGVPNATVTDLEDMRQDDRYTVIVRAVGADGSTSSPYVLSLIKPKPVENIYVTTLSIISTKFLSVAWPPSDFTSEEVNHFELCWESLKTHVKNCTQRPPRSYLYVDPCSWYNITVTAVAPNGLQSDVASVLHFVNGTGTEDTGEILELDATTLHLNSLRVSWQLSNSSCNSLTRVCWTLIDEDDAANDTCDDVPSYLLDKNIMDLKFCSNYSVSVLPEGQEWGGKTDSAVTGSAKPVNVSAETIGLGVAKVTWRLPVSGENCLYLMQMVSMSSGQDYGIVWSNETEHVVEDLPLCTYLDFSLVPVGPGFKEDVSLSYAYTGLAPPSEVRDVEAVQTTSHSIQVKWRAPADDVECLKEYSVCWKESSGGDETCSKKKATAIPQHTLTGLEPCTEYVVNVTTLGGNNTRGPSIEITESTGPEPVTDLAVAGQLPSLGELTVSWQPRGCAQHYRVCWGDWESSGLHSCGNTSGTNYTLTSLETYYNYTVIVVAIGPSDSASDNAVLPVYLNTEKRLELTLKYSNPTDEVAAYWTYSPGEGAPLSTLVLCAILEASDLRKCATVNASASEVVVRGLQPCSRYKLRAIALDAVSQALDATQMEVFTTEKGDADYDDIPKVTGFMVANITSRSVSFKWGRVAHKKCVSKYSLRVNSLTGTTSWYDIPNDTYSYVVEPVSPCNLLYASIYAVLPNGDDTATTEIKTDTGTEAPGDVENIEVFHTTSTSINIKWKPPSDNNDCLVRYMVCRRAGDTQAESCSEQTHSSFNAYSIVGLQPCTNYTFSIAAMGSEKDIGNVTSIAWSTGPEPVRALAARSDTSREVTLSWEAPTCAQSYSVCWGAWTDRGAYSCGSTALTSYTISGLSEGTTYSMIVAAVAEEGQLSDKEVLSWSAISDGEAGIDGFEITKITPSSVHLKWNGYAPENLIDHYVLDVFYFSALVESYNISNTVNTFVVCEVVPCIQLTFSMYAVLPDGRNTTASKIKTDTGTEAPGEVEGLEVFHTTSNSIHLLWKPPSNNTYCLFKYLVCWRAQNVEAEKCSELAHSSYNGFSIRGLEPCTEYSISVATMGSDKDIGNATVISWSTGPKRVSSLTGGGHRPHEVTLSWEAPNCARGYSVCWGAWTDRGAHSCDRTTLTSYTVSGLNETKPYSVIVKAEIEEGRLSDLSIIMWNGTGVSTSLLGQISSTVNKTVHTTINTAGNLLGSIGL